MTPTQARSEVVKSPRCCHPFALEYTMLVVVLVVVIAVVVVNTDILCGHGGRRVQAAAVGMGSIIILSSLWVPGVPSSYQPL